MASGRSIMLWKIQRKLTAALLVASVACFGYGGCTSDLGYFVDDLAGYVGVPFYDEFYVEEVYYEDPYYYDDGFEFEFWIY